MGEKQTRIEGTEPTTIPEVNRAIEQFLEARQGKKNADDTQKRCQTDLIAKMKKHGLTRVKDPLSDDDGITIELDAKDVVHVKKTPKPRERGRRRG